jgi:hypothetical protein
LKKNFLSQEGKKKHLTLRVLAVLFLAFGFTFLNTPTPAHSETTPGLTQDVYTYDSSATPDRVPYTLCNTSTVANLQFDVGGGVVANCQEDFVLIHWYGYITLPVDGEVMFQSWADDGFYMTLDDQVVIDNWWLKGCSGGSGTAVFESGVSQKIDIWWYEYGGGACNYLLYNDPTTQWIQVPDTAFSIDAVPVIPVDPPVDPEPEPTDPPVEPPVDPPVDPEPVDPDPPVVEPEEPVTPEPPVVVPEEPVEPPTVPTEPERPIIEPVLPEPTPTESLKSLVDIAPAELTPAQVEQIQEISYEVLATSEQGSPEYEAALDALFVAAQADDIEVSEELAAVPVIGAVAEGVVNAINFIGNVGSDMSPTVREKSEKIVVSAVVVAQVATAAVMTTSSVRRFQ